jgi:hypothetical protein
MVYILITLIFSVQAQETKSLTTFEESLKSFTILNQDNAITCPNETFQKEMNSL